MKAIATQQSTVEVGPAMNKVELNEAVLRR